VSVRDDAITYFLAGDATYTEANLLTDRVDAVTYNPAVARDAAGNQDFRQPRANDTTPLTRPRGARPAGKSHRTLTGIVALLVSSSEYWPLWAPARRVLILRPRRHLQESATDRQECQRSQRPLVDMGPRRKLD
jgi:hypothetical protein